MAGKILKALKSRLDDPFWKNVATLFSGSAIAQALPLIILPLITRMYSKEALGFYFVYVAIGMLTQIVASLKYELSIVLPKQNEDAHYLLTLNFVLVFVISLFMFLGIFVFKDFIIGIIKEPQLENWLFAIPVSTFFLGIFNSISYYFNRIKKYKAIAIGKVSKSIVFSVFQIVFALIGFVKSGLIMGLILGQFASMAMLLFYLLKTDYRFQIDMKEGKRLLVKYKDIPMFNTLIAFVNTLSNQLPLFLLAKWFGTVAAGDYGLANRIISTPLQLVSKSVGQIFYQESASINNKKGNVQKLIVTVYKRLIKIALIPTVLFTVFAPIIFKIFFGPGFFESARMVQIIVPWVFLGFISQSVSSVFTVLNKQKFMTYINVIVLVLRFGGLLVGYYFFNNVLISILCYALAGLFFNIFQLYYFYKIANQNVSY